MALNEEWLLTRRGALCSALPMVSLSVRQCALVIIGVAAVAASAGGTPRESPPQGVEGAGG